MKYYENEVFDNINYRNEKIDNIEYIDCEFNKCTFIDSEFSKCIFKDCKFNKCTMNNVTFRFSTMKNSVVDNCEFIGINWATLRGDIIEVEPIQSARECFFKYNNFIFMKLNKFNFSGSRFQKSLFQECDLIEANFKEVRFESTEFIQCNISKADFRDSYGYQIDIRTNKLTKSKFSFPEVTSLLNSIDIIID